MTRKIAVAAVLSALWFAPFCSPAHSDPAVDALMKKVAKAMGALHSASGTLTAFASPHFGSTSDALPTDRVGTFKFSRPNLLREDDWEVETGGKNWHHRLTAPHYIVASNGTTYWTINSDGSMSTGKVDANGNKLGNINETGDNFFISSMFFGTESMPDFGKGSQATVGKDEFWDGAKYQAIQFTMTGSSSGAEPPYSVHGEILIGSDMLLHRFVMDAGKMGHFEIAITDLHTDRRFAKSDFRFKPPRWAKVATSQAAAPDISKVTIDPSANRVFDTVNSKMRSIQSLKADFTDTLYMTSVHNKKPRWTNSYHSGTVRLLRPNYARMEYGEVFTSTRQKTPKHEPTETVASDGNTLWDLWDPIAKFYESSPVKPNGSNIQLYYCELLRGSFFTGDPYQSGMTGWDRGYVFYAGQCVWHGAKYKRIEARLYADGTPEESFVAVQTYLIGQDNLVHYSYDLSRFGNGTVLREEHTLTNVQLNPPLSKSDFAYSLPAGSTEKIEFPDVPSTPPPPPPAILANGTQAPDFTAYDPKGNPVKLSDFSGKVVVLDFWATWCGPCQMSLPNTAALAKKLAGQNVQFLAVNVWDTKDAFDSWLPKHKQFSSLKFAIDTTPGQGDDIAQKLYHVSGIPTQFVIDPSGKVVNSFIGYDPDTAALAAAVKTAEGK